MLLPFAIHLEASDIGPRVVSRKIEVLPFFEHTTCDRSSPRAILLRARWRKEPLPIRRCNTRTAIRQHVGARGGDHLSPSEELPISSRRISPETDTTYDLDSSAMNRVISHVL